MRSFAIEGIAYCFNNNAFRSILDNAGRERGMNKGEMVQSLADSLHVTKEAVINWKYDRNGPSDLKTIEEIASYLHVDRALLLRQNERGSKMQPLSDRQKDAAKRIYDVLTWFLEEFNNSDGFSSWWSDIALDGGKPSEDAVYERITQMEERIHLVLNQEYFDLFNHEIYDDFCEFASEDLEKVYVGKIGYGYRYEADEGHPSVWQDYEAARHRLNEIVERYI